MWVQLSGCYWFFCKIDIVNSHGFSMWTLMLLNISHCAGAVLR